MKTRKVKLIAIVLSVLLIVSVFPVATAKQAPQQLGVDIVSFAKSAKKIGGISADSTADEGAPTGDRLIVKSDSVIGDMGAVSKAEGFAGLHFFKYASAADAAKAYAAYAKMSTVEWVQYDDIVKVDSIPTADPVDDNDRPGDYLSWGADYIGAYDYENYLASFKLNKVTVAVIDTGADFSHELLSGRLLTNGINLSSTGDYNDPQDDMGHGTHVAGTIVDLTADNVKILPIKVLDSDGSGYTSSIATAILYAAYNGADIINMSLGGSVDGESFVEEYVIDMATEMGVTVVVAAGNESYDISAFSPSNVENCITVASLGKNLESSYFSNYGNGVDIAAPGENIYSALLGGGYTYMSGTSMASPHVAAAAALLKSDNPTMTPAQVSDWLTGHAFDLGDSGYDKYYGFGLLRMELDTTAKLPVIKAEIEQTEEYDGVEKYITSPATVSLSCEGADTIYYTTDGTYPLGAGKTVYSGSFTVSRTSRLRAIAVSESGKQSFEQIKDIWVTDTEPVYSLVIDGSTLKGYLGILPEKLTVPANVTAIGDYAFFNNAELVEILFGGTVREIGDYAFVSCNNLNEIDLSKTEHIGDSAFEGCYSLLAIETPLLKSAGDRAFAGAMDTMDDLPINMPQLSSAGESLFAYTGITSAFLPLISEASAYMFYGCGNLKSVDMPLTKVGDYAFAYCENFENAAFDNVTEAGEGAFSGLSLYSFNMPALEKIGEGAFAYCSFYDEDFDAIVIPKLREVADYAFYDATPGTLSLPNATYVGEYAFADDTAVFNIDLPNVTEIGEGAFYGNTYLETIVLPKVVSIGESAFEDSVLKSVEMSVVGSIGDYAFNNAYLSAVVLGKSFTTAGDDVFDINYPDFCIIGYPGTYAEQYAEKEEYEFISVGTKFTVIFNDIYGNEVSRQEVEAGECVQVPDDPKSPFRVFLGWDGDVEKVICRDSVFNATSMNVVNYWVSQLLTDFIVWTYRQFRSRGAMFNELADMIYDTFWPIFENETY